MPRTTLEIPWSRLESSLASELGAGTVSRRPLDLHALSHDASHYLLTPELLVRPTSTAQVAAVMAACDRVGAPITFRSGGTSLSGQAITDAVLVDTRRHFTDVQVLDGGARVLVQPGVTVRAVNARLAPYHRKLGPDPASEGACTLGGVIANNSSGMHCGTELNTYATLESMTFVLPSGTVIDSGAPDAEAELAAREPELVAGLLALRRRVLADPTSVATIERLFSMKNTMGYGINALLDFESPLDMLVHLMIGSEGTLGFVASAVLATVPVHPEVATGLLVFDTIGEATGSVPALAGTDVATAELLDAASLRVAQQDPRCPPQIAALGVDEHAALLVEWQGGTGDELDAALAAAAPTLDLLPLTAPARLTRDTGQRAGLWKVRKGLFSAVAGARPAGTNALLEDVVVGVDVLGETCVALTELFAAHDYQESVIFGHARDGNVHFMLNERFDDPASMRRYEAFTEDMVDLVLGRGGSLKAEHGTGRIMAPFVRRQYGDELYAVMWELKRLIDPRGLLNPAAVLSDEPTSYLQDLKPSPRVEEEVDRCVECGYCEPVCPSKDLTLTPRQRIVVRRDIQTAREAGDHALADSLERDYDYDGNQTCAVDGMCQSACPVLIDTGDLTRRLRRESAGRVVDAAWAGAARAWGTVGPLGGLALSTAKLLPSGLPVAATRVVRAVAGTDTVPLYDGRLPGGGTRRQELDPDSPAAVLFSTCIGEMFGTEPGGHTGDLGSGAAGALVDLCVRADIPLRTPEGLGGLCCGTPWKSKGMTSGYAVMTDRVVTALRRATEQGRLPIVVEASSCVEGLMVMLAEHAPDLRVVDALDFVHQTVLPRLRVRRGDRTVVVHPTCSSERAGSTPALIALARAVATDVVVPTDWGCCAFAGDRGLLHPELTASATAAEAAEVAAITAGALAGRGSENHPHRNAAATPLSQPAFVSSNRTCEIGMSRATGHPYRHVLELLAEASQA
ncbi:FAD-binding and (Fe-S)-binding domain-containing protein [Serinicoccus profundi]|uniref:FAD-binding and (Fe-S)-binding domain-containing protein n=1 Tax=Serinicoccus profundi TaxID=1078471 RepID=UPI000255E3A2|nr:FAD-binding and (Fe-S)-binding domain-containing protein [Serinicoccus profundi]